MSRPSWTVISSKLPSASSSAVMKYRQQSFALSNCRMSFTNISFPLINAQGNNFKITKHFNILHLKKVPMIT